MSRHIRDIEQFLRRWRVRWSRRYTRLDERKGCSDRPMGMGYSDEHPCRSRLPCALRFPELVKFPHLIPRTLHAELRCRDFISGLVGFLYADAWRTRIDALMKLVRASGR